jgi:hypothetical protein
MALIEDHQNHAPIIYSFLVISLIYLRETSDQAPHMTFSRTPRALQLYKKRAQRTFSARSETHTLLACSTLLVLQEIAVINNKGKAMKSGQLLVLTLTVTFSIGMLQVSPTLAKPGGVLVDDDSDCNDTNREENVFGNLEQIVIWVNKRNSQGASAITSVKVYNNGKQEVASANLGAPSESCTATDANRDFVNYDFTFDYSWNNGYPPTGSYTLKAFDVNGRAIGSDSFRIQLP